MKKILILVSIFALTNCTTEDSNSDKRHSSSNSVVADSAGNDDAPKKSGTSRSFASEMNRGPTIMCPAGENLCNANSPISDQYCCPYSCSQCTPVVPDPTPEVEAPVAESCVNVNYTVVQVPFHDANSNGQLDPGEEPDCSTVTPPASGSGGARSFRSSSPSSGTWCANTNQGIAFAGLCEKLRNQFDANPSQPSGAYCVFVDKDLHGNTVSMHSICSFALRDWPYVPEYEESEDEPNIPTLPPFSP